MHNQISRRPTRAQSWLASIIIWFDGISALIVGLIFLFIAGIGDPVDFSVEAKEAGIRLGEFVALLAGLYLISCLISIAYWRRGKPKWGYVLMGLGLMHAAWSTYLVIESSWDRSFVYFFAASLVLNIALHAIILQVKQRQSIPVRDQDQNPS